MTKKISSLTELSTAPADDDLLVVVDVSDTSGGASGTTKKISVENLLSGGSGDRTIQWYADYTSSATVDPNYKFGLVKFDIATDGVITVDGSDEAWADGDWVEFKNLGGPVTIAVDFGEEEGELFTPAGWQCIAGCAGRIRRSVAAVWEIEPYWTPPNVNADAGGGNPSIDIAPSYAAAFASLAHEADRYYSFNPSTDGVYVIAYELTLKLATGVYRFIASKQAIVREDDECTLLGDSATDTVGLDDDVFIEWDVDSGNVRLYVENTTGQTLTGTIARTVSRRDLVA